MRTRPSDPSSRRSKLLLPIVFGLLYLFALGLPTGYRLRGGHAIVVVLTIGATAGIAAYSALVCLRRKPRAAGTCGGAVDTTNESAGQRVCPSL